MRKPAAVLERIANGRPRDVHGNSLRVCIAGAVVQSRSINRSFRPPAAIRSSDQQQPFDSAISPNRTRKTFDMSGGFTQAKLDRQNISNQSVGGSDLRLPLQWRDGISNLAEQ